MTNPSDIFTGIPTSGAPSPAPEVEGHVVGSVVEYETTDVDGSQVTGLGIVTDVDDNGYRVAPLTPLPVLFTADQLTGV